jgi:alkanesulfonate monooxygenase SsuD/methylene tetrahydromethanopterin reductase-like flavin-dependent oxidoreductase (luciferase family)
MKVGVHVSSFTRPGGPQRLAQNLTRVAQAAEANGFAKLSVMDHLWQIARNGPPEREMLEAYTTLGYLAARTTRIQLLAWVTAVAYREPGLLAKAVTTLDVLSEGPAWLGIGAASFEEEARGLGLPFPPAGQRFERLEEALQICLQMWSEDDGPYAGRHYQLQRTLNSPQPPRRRRRGCARRHRIPRTRTSNHPCGERRRDERRSDRRHPAGWPVRVVRPVVMARG